MKKYTIRIGALILAFIVGITFIYLTTWDKITDLITPKSKHSVENGSPFSTIDKNKITVKPFNASFEIPEKWLEYTREKNIFLNCGEIKKIDFEYGINFNEEDGQVMDAVIPFEYCAAHFGSKNWGISNVDHLQGRIYVTNLTQDEVSKRIERDGLDKAKSIFEKAKLKDSAEYNNWQYKSLDILDAPTHAFFFKEICFYYRAFEDKTVVFTFRHADKYESEINFILSSFEWQTKDNKTSEKNSQTK
jgi:hypothetical protein